MINERTENILSQPHIHGGWHENDVLIIIKGFRTMSPRFGCFPGGVRRDMRGVEGDNVRHYNITRRGMGAYILIEFCE